MTDDRPMRLDASGKLVPLTDDDLTQRIADAAAAVSGPVPTSTSTRYTFLGFLGLFTQAEQAAIVASTNTQVRLFCLMAAGANYVDLDDPRVVTGTQGLEALGLIAAGRAAQVLAGDAAPAA